MDLAVKIIVGTFITMILILASLDVYLNRTMMTMNFHSNRASSQGSLYDVQDKYNNNEELTSVEMLNNWIINFIDTHGIDYEKVNLKFHRIETDPPVYIVTVEGYEDEYTYLSGNAYFEYTSATTIIEEEEEDE